MVKKTKRVALSATRRKGGKIKPIEEEKKAQKEAEAASQDLSVETLDEEQVEAAEAEKGTRTEEAMPAEAAAVHEDTETAQEAEKKVKPSSKIEKPLVKKLRSAKYLKSREGIEKEKIYSLEEGIELAQKSSWTKFDATVELHVRLAKPKKETEGLRGLVALPYPVKTPKIAIADEKLIGEIEKGKTDFDILLATPEMMPALAKVAKILGPKGKMPSPKSGTVTTDPEKTKKEIEQGKIEYRSDANFNIHLAVGKVSWPKEKILENIKDFLKVLPQGRIQSLTLSSTMGPGIKVKI